MSFPNIKLILLIVGFVSLCGCASRASSLAKATAKIDSCSLITKEEAAAALDGDIEVTLTDKACAYSGVATRSSSNATRHGNIVVIVVTSDSPEFQKFGLSHDEDTVAKSISGLGDRAVLFESRARPDEGARAIQVLKGNVYVAIGMSTSPRPVSVDVLKSLAAKALSRLPTP